MKRKRKSGSSYFSFGPIVAGAFFAGLGFFIARKASADEDDSSSFEKTYVDKKAKPRSKKAVSQLLKAPLVAPLRQPTPHGYYGARRPTDVKLPLDHYHQGVDLGGTAGEKILAVGDGKIVPSNPGKGEIVRVLLLNDGRAVVYADIGTPLVKDGDILKAGDTVGLVRPNGFVHVAIRESRYGKFMDPTGIIPYDNSNVPQRIV